MGPFELYNRPSDVPFTLDASGTARAGARTTGRVAAPFGQTELTALIDRLRIPHAWLGMSGYLAAGVFVGLVLILTLSLGRDGEASSDAITDNIVRLHASEIGNTCWAGIDRTGPARLTVALEVGVDGKIRYATASGETPVMRGCVEAHVKSWEFLPQAQAQAMALPFEIDRTLR